MWQIAILLLLGLLASQDVRTFLKLFVDKYYRRYISISNPSTPAQSRKGSYSNDEELPRPTPLMITPEQVKNYDDRPWRPFRWPYHQTMSIFKLDINHWLDMDKYYWHYIEEKKRVFMKYGKQNIDWLPGSEDACLELMETVSQHMIERYPLLFTVLIDKKSKGRVVKNELTREILDMTLPLKEHPLVYVLKMAKEDFYLVKQSPEDGLHRLVAAAVPFPGGSFDILTKIGKHIDAIHADVPYYKEKLRNSMQRWFLRLQPNGPVERASWYMSWDHKLKMSNVYQLPEIVPDLEESLKLTEPGSFNVRVERQTLRRLPRSQAIVFTNHPVFYSLDEMRDEPMVPSLIRKILYEGPQDIVKYKNFELFRDHVAPYLDELIQSQIDRGLITEDQPVKTLPTYPFAHWAKTDFDYVNGWNNPKFNGKKPDYSEQAKAELIYSND